MDTWPKCTRSAADGGGGSDHFVWAGGWAAGVGEQAFGVGPFGSGALGGGAFGGGALGGASFGEEGAGERDGPEPGSRRWVGPTEESAWVVVAGSPTAVGMVVDRPR
jgi:hypothetical protein